MSFTVTVLIDVTVVYHHAMWAKGDTKAGGLQGWSRKRQVVVGAGEGVSGEAVAQDFGEPGVGAGLCVCQGGEAGDLLPQGCSSAPCRHCGCQSHGH